MAYNDAEYGNALEAALAKMITRHAVGEMWVGFSTAEKPAGVLLRDASLQSRGLYAALWQWAQDKGLVLTEAEWQAEYTANGVCHKYSDGDGSTTFRMPSAPLYIKGAENAGEAGAYVAESLPDHTHTRGTMEITGAVRSRGFVNDGNHCIQVSQGAFYEESGGASDVMSSGVAGGTFRVFKFAASRTWTGSTSTANASNPIYGASAHVTPATSKLLFGVWAVSTAGVAVPDANAEEILAAVQRSADTDLSNLTTAGKEVAAKASMPSGRYVELTLGASGAQYIAPADGFFILFIESTVAGGWFRMYNTINLNGIIERTSYAYSGIQGFVSVRKGDVIILQYDALGGTTTFRFIYAEGAE